MPAKAGSRKLNTFLDASLRWHDKVFKSDCLSKMLGYFDLCFLLPMSGYFGDNKMKRIVAGGTGFIGSHLVERWLAQGYETIIITRDKQRVLQKFSERAIPLTWSALESEGIKHL